MKHQDIERFAHGVGQKVTQAAAIVGAMKVLFDAGQSVATTVGPALGFLAL